MLEKYSKISSEERANVLSHAIALLVFVVVIPIMIIKAVPNISSVAVFGLIVFSLTSLFGYFASVRYHLSHEADDKHYWRRIDHICIYLLIGGSYTAYILRFMDTKEGLWFLALHWMIIVGGILKKVWFTGRYELISVASYLFLGWMVMFIYDDITVSMNPSTYRYLWIGGAFYTIGVIFYIWDRLPYNHLIWHIFVFGGTICHFWSLWSSI